LRTLISVLAGAGLLFGAYVISFGVPERLAPYLGAAAGAEAAPSAEARPGGGAGRPGGRGGATSVVLAPLEARPHDLVLRTIGSATSLRNVEVVASVSGEVAEVRMAANASVAKGDVLLRLDDRAQRLAVEIAETERDEAQASLNRYNTLKDNGNLTITDVAMAEAEVALRLAEANLALAQVALEVRTIRAPMSGRLGLSTLETGTYVSAGTALVTIDDSSALIAEFEVPERSIGLLEVGRVVQVGTPTYVGRVFEGVITAFDSRLDSVTRSATVRARIDNSAGELLSGMTFAVRMIEETEPLPVVPSTAVTWDRSGAGIWVSDAGRVTRHPVAIRYREGDQLWVETDVPLGAQIVAEGAAKLREGAQVNDAAEARPSA